MESSTRKPQNQGKIITWMVLTLFVSSFLFMCLCGVQDVCVCVSIYVSMCVSVCACRQVHLLRQSPPELANSSSITSLPGNPFSASLVLRWQRIPTPVVLASKLCPLDVCRGTLSIDPLSIDPSFQYQVFLTPIQHEWRKQKRKEPGIY